MIQRLKPIAVLAMTLVMLPAAWAFAKDMVPDGKWWRNPRIAQRMDLDADETARLDAAFVDSRRKMIRLKSEVESQQFELEQLIENPELDEAAAREQYGRLDEARNRLGAERFGFLLEVRKILGHERFRQLMSFRKMQRRQMRDKRRGGPGRYRQSPAQRPPGSGSPPSGSLPGSE